MDSDKEEKKEKKSSKGLKGIMDKILSPNKSEEKRSSRESSKYSSRGSNDITDERNGNYQLPVRNEKFDDKILENEKITISDELSQGIYSSLYHAEYERNYATMIKPKDDNSINIKNIEYQSKVVIAVTPNKNLWSIQGVTKNPPGLLMEAVDGFLDDKVHATKLDPHTITSFALEIAKGMSHLHSEGILHCNLACSSIIAEKQEDQYMLKIGGFDLSCFEKDETKITELNRNENWPFRYTAPEVLLHNKVSKASDVWSFGVLLWEMCERKLPYEGLTKNQVTEGVCKEGLRLKITYTPAGLASLMERCWSEPAERPSFDDICATLDGLLKEYKKKK